MKWLWEGLRFLLGVVVTIVITSMFTGQPLSGLVKLKTFWQTFLMSTVPAWAFALVVFLALLGAYYAFKHFPKKMKRKGKVHFIPDGSITNNGWNIISDSMMEIRVCGTFTWDGDGTLIVLQAFLKGTRPVGNMTVLVDGIPQLAPQLWLEHNLPVRAQLFLQLNPLLGKRGELCKGQLLLRDKFAKDWPIDPFLFHYMGPKAEPGKRA